ncbi:MAG: M28 family peptidase [Gemmatimonadetes bacterium]|nr:M28 family peptidase [Gemmatimonadota bacterium]
MTSHADAARLATDVRALEGERHPRTSPGGLAKAADYIERELGAAGLVPERRPFSFGGETYINIAAVKPGADPERPRVLVGAHFDSVAGTPGADDNASGVAGMLEAARLLAGERLDATVEFVAFNLEELQTWTYRVGSRRYAAAQRRAGVRYAGALVLEMLGYVSPTRPSVPALLFWKKIPRTSTFVVATGDGQSRDLLRTFAASAASAAPALPVVTLHSPFRGWLVPHTRLSDNASFWDNGYPSLMITDTAFLRNPHYHRRTDSAATLDFNFMADVVTAVAATVVAAAGG